MSSNKHISLKHSFLKVYEVKFRKIKSQHNIKRDS